MTASKPISMRDLLATLPQRGQVGWIGIRPEKFATMSVLTEVQADQDLGLVGDRYAKRRGKRQVTLIQEEHLEALKGLLHIGSVEPDLLRRNIVVRGINLLALKGHRFWVGSAMLEFTGLCHPCSRMERALGRGGYNAMRGHGGITARVCESGQIAVGDPVVLEKIVTS